MNHKGTKRIETENLILRRFEYDDAEAVFKNWASDELVTKYLTWGPMEDVNISKNVVSGWVDEYKNQDFYQWAIVSKENGEEPIGTISSVGQDDKIEMIQVGYCIGSQWWNRGITSEALEAIIDYFINEVKVNRIESRHDPLNPGSGKVMMKCGMKYEGTLRKADINNQGICDCAYYAILAEDYIELKEKINIYVR